MRNYILNGDPRKRVIAFTPAKGSEGDLTVQSDAVKTDINNILHRYAGNLAELKAWQDGKEYGVQSPLGDDLLDATSVFDRLQEQYDSNDDLNSKFESFESFIRSVNDGSFVQKLKGKQNEQKKESEQKGKPEDIQKIGEPPAPIEH